MTGILAFDTSTEVCSVALSLGGEVQHRRDFVPRRHNQHLFVQLDELLGDRSLPDAGVELLAWAHGPGSFTGLRIAAGAVQGLAFANDLPVAGVSTLAAMAQGAWRRGEVPSDALALALLDARIGELYWGLCELRDGLAHSLVEDEVCSPEEFALPEAVAGRAVVPVGNGARYIGEFDPEVMAKLAPPLEDCWPEALDVLPLAAALGESAHCTAEQVCPVYLRNDMRWKKLSEQGG